MTNKELKINDCDFVPHSMIKVIRFKCIGAEGEHEISDFNSLMPRRQDEVAEGNGLNLLVYEIINKIQT